ncbi:hypothetical protein QFC21_003071 [Naganishia friedmannii]|uniref:Uncharacterized protein n=1 Tax=Naganishia friedmannii TaxID=89922 RepID=A0ACC2VTF3_9TREE|nr:hypothetical protein QFC21_003071 [Naganishia friedmannii]
MEDVTTPLAVPGQVPSMPVMIRLNDDLEDLHVSDGIRQQKRKGSYIVVSGGTAANDFVQAFGRDCAFVLPGNGVTDLDYDKERLKGIEAAHDLFAQRFPASCTESQAKDMWGDIIEGKSDLWKGIPEDRREAMRAFFVHFNNLILRRAHKHFSFKNCSLGNVFLAAARDMLGGLPGAIFMFKAVTDSQGTAQVMPVIVTNQRITIATKLRSDSMSFDTTHMTYSEDETSTDSDSDSSTITDENDVTSSGFDTRSESDTSFKPQRALPGSPWRDPFRLSEDEKTENERIDAYVLGQSLRSTARKTRNKYKRASKRSADEEETGGNALYVKGSQEVPLESRIERLFYIENAYGHEIFPDPNTEMIKQLKQKETLVYSCGSLWTSIIPCLALRGVASAIARSKTLKHKVLLLNFKNDRETEGYVAIDYVNAIVASLNRYNKPRRGEEERSRRYEVRQLLTHMVYLEGGKVDVDVAALEAIGITVIKVPALAGSKFSKEAVEWAMCQL